MPRKAMWILVALLSVIFLLAVSIPVDAKVMGPPGGGGGGGGGSSGGSKEKDPCDGVPPPSVRRPWAANECYYIVESSTQKIPEPPDWTGTNDWTWGYRVDGSHMGGIEKAALQWAPGYPMNVDELSHTKPLRYDFAGSREGTYYIEDDYNDWLRYYYDRVRLERGRVTFRALCWVRVWKRDIYQIDKWNDGVREMYKVSEERSTRDGPGETNPDSICNLNPYASGYNLWDWISFDEYDQPMKAPPIYRPIPPSGIVPPPIFSGYESYLGGREVIKNDYKTKDDWGEGGKWLFGGKPHDKKISGTRGAAAMLHVYAKAEGDRSFTNAKNQVTQVRVRVLGGFPNSQWIYATRSSGKPWGDSTWIVAIPIPLKTRLGYYPVEIEIHGYNFWGMPRLKTLNATLIVNAGDREDPGGNPGDVGLCGRSEKEMEHLGPIWIYDCVDPALIK